MGNYNPHAPSVVGNEWVPIRQENYQPDEITERGYGFYLDNSTVIVSGSNSIADVPTALSTNKIMLNAIYPAGLEDETGPIHQVTIPVDGVTVTGSGVSAFVADFLTPTDDNSALLGSLTLGEGIGLSFDVSSYSAQLNGKRILNVELLYTANGEPSDLAQMRVDIGRAASSGPSAQTFAYQQGLEGSPFEVPNTRIATVQFKDVNVWWNNSISPTLGSLPREVFPWRYTELALLDASATPSNAKLQVSIFWVDSVDSISSVFINYAALRVTYCEEQRVLYGARMPASFDALPGSVLRHRFLNTSFAHGSTSLGPGNYVVTSTFRSLSNEVIDSQLGEDTTTPWSLYALRQLDELSTLPGVQVNTTKVVDAEFTEEPSDVLPQTMMYTAAAIVTGSHAYGAQAQAAVYGSVTASQAINGLAGISAGTSSNFSQTRFYARRFGNASAPLTLGAVGGLYLTGIAGDYASTPDNAALDITGDIDLRAEATLDDWNALGVLVSKWNDTGNQRSYVLQANVGALQLVWSNNGTTVLAELSVAHMFAPGMRGAVRVTLDVDNGAAGHTTTFYTAPSIAGPWTVLGTPIITAGVTSIFNSTASGEVGTINNGANSIANGIIHAVEIVNSVGTTVANPNFEAQATGTTVFVDAAGRTWTINGNAEIVADSPNLASITAAELNDLPEIVDGWREVTLPLLTPYAFATADVRLIWESAGTPSGSQWQILGSNGPSLAGAFGSGNASYAPPSGSTLNMSGSGITNQNTDAPLMFALTPPAVTGIALDVCTIEVTGIGQGCAGVPQCIPTHILGNGLTWEVPGVIYDFFETPEVTGWGMTGTGETWTQDADTTVGVTTSVSDGHGIHTLPAASSGSTSIPVAGADFLFSGQFTLPEVPVGGAGSEINYGIDARFQDLSNFLFIRVIAGPDGNLVIRAGYVLAGNLTFIDKIIGAYATNVPMNMEANFSGLLRQIRVWSEDDEKPDWQVTATDNPILTAGTLRIRTDTSVGTTNVPFVVQFDNMCITPSSVAGGALEIQRTDTVEDEWKTVALLPDFCSPSFCDFEARVGVESSYRLRTVNALNFPGDWSADLTTTLASPGVSGVGDGNSVLIFTSNQDTSASLAYVMNWEGEPVESFSFPEAGFQQLRTQYGRDFFVAFRPTERGGEQFSRTILVQAAAIPPESLADFKSLRDLAWQDLPYVCVRDELGNRWFANVAVPNGRIRNNRTLYLAEVNITEVTDTPAPVVE